MEQDTFTDIHGAGHIYRHKRTFIEQDTFTDIKGHSRTHVRTRLETNNLSCRTRLATSNLSCH